MCRFSAPNHLAPAPAPGAAPQRPQQYDDDFLQYTYKVVPCDKTWRHDFASCPFAHAGESAERRHPLAYLPFMCSSTQHSTDLKEKCPFGTACKYAHGHFELWLHPGRFRTKMCSLGAKCRRPVCFFAHSEQELRVTPFSKLDTTAAVAAQQLSQLEAAKAGSSLRSSCDGSEAKAPGSASTNLSSPCGSEAGLSSLGSSSSTSAAADKGAGGGSSSSPCASVSAEEALLAYAAAAGMPAATKPALGSQAALLDLQAQLQHNSAYLAAAAAADASGLAAAATGGDAGLWLGRGLPMQHASPGGLPAFGGSQPFLQPCQQLVMLEPSAPMLGFASPLLQPGAGLLAGAPGAADPWAATSSLLAAQQQRQLALAARFGAGAGVGGLQQSLPVPAMLAPGGGAAGLDQWLPQGCGLGHAQQPSAQVLQLLGGLPDSAVQQLLALRI